MSTNPTGMRQRGYKEWGGTSQPSSVRAQAAFGDESHKKVPLAEETSQEGTAGTSELSSVTEAGDWAGHVRKAIEPRPSCASVSGSHYSDDHFRGENERERDVRCSAAVGAGVAEGVCGTTEVAPRVTVTTAMCWLLVGVKVTSAHVRFLKVCLFLSGFVFLQWPQGAERLNISS